MVEDFRTLLTEIERVGNEERYYEAFQIGDWFIFDVQASPIHDCDPLEVLDDPFAYKAFQVTLSTTRGAISWGNRGAWQDLQEKEWASCFRRYQPSMLIASLVPPETVQQIFEDLVEYASTNI